MSQLLTLFTTPVVYLYLDRFQLGSVAAAPPATTIVSRSPPIPTKMQAMNRVHISNGRALSPL